MRAVAEPWRIFLTTIILFRVAGSVGPPRALLASSIQPLAGEVDPREFDFNHAAMTAGAMHPLRMEKWKIFEARRRWPHFWVVERRVRRFAFLDSGKVTQQYSPSHISRTQNLPQQA